MLPSWILTAETVQGTVGGGGIFFILQIHKPRFWEGKFTGQSVIGMTWARTQDSFLPAQNSLPYIRFPTDEPATQARSLDKLLFSESVIRQLPLCSVARPPDIMVHPTAPILAPALYLLPLPLS